MMKSNPWRYELRRFVFIIISIIFLYQIIGSWSLSITIALLAYIALILYQLSELDLWLKNGIDEALTPDSQGIIGQIISQIYRYKKLIDHSHHQQQSTIQQFHDIISAIPSATIILNQNHEIEWANYPALLLLGINGQRDIGIKIDNLLRQATLSEHLIKNNSEEFEIVSPIDNTITLAIQIAQYARRKRILIAHNITPHIEVQRSRKTFIENASHELRTPLTVIAGYLEFIHSDPNLPKSLRLPVEKAVEQSADMQVLINDLLMLSKLENRTLNSERVSRIDLQEHLARIIRTLSDDKTKQNHKIDYHVDKGAFVEASEKELDSICYNLINNAIKYSEPGSKIQVSWKKMPKKQVQFSVSDQGIGIAPEHINHLAERFYRVDSGRSRRVGGTGLGLSIVKHIVERHHGRMEIHSRLGEGSTFSVTLPIYVDKQDSNDGNQNPLS